MYTYCTFYQVVKLYIQYNTFIHYCNYILLYHQLSIMSVQDSTETKMLTYSTSVAMLIKSQHGIDSFLSLLFFSCSKTIRGEMLPKTASPRYTHMLLVVPYQVPVLVVRTFSFPFVHFFTPLTSSSHTSTKSLTLSLRSFFVLLPCEIQMNNTHPSHSSPYMLALE